MNETNNSLLLRWARWQTRTLARLWPAESRRWGQAIASEAEEIDQPLAALGWALGGVAVFLRALISHLLGWFKLPMGQRSSGALPPLTGAPGPKRSRLFAAVALAGAAALLCLPEGREATRTLGTVWESVWYGVVERDSPRTILQKLAKQAQKTNDARILAFTALSIRNEEQRIALADRAVALDPQLVWIYVAQGRLRDEPAPTNWLAKVEAADPDNAVPYLMAADAVARSSANGNDQHSMTAREMSDSLPGNPQWLALMDKAFHAPRYDSYYSLHRELNREAWRRNPELPFTSVFQGLAAHAIPNLFHIRTFAKFLVRESEQQRIAGQSEKAGDLLQEVDAFGSRMRQPGSTDIEKLIGASCQKDATQGWKAFYEATGRTAQAQAAAQHLSLIDETFREDAAERRRIWSQRKRGTADAWLIQLSAFVMLLTVILALASIGLFEVRPAIWNGHPRTGRVASWVADYAPATALLASVVFLLSFLPYARLFAAFRAGNPDAQDPRVLTVKFWTLLDVSETVIGNSDSGVFRWTLFTVLLSALAALLLARLVYRALRPSTTHA
jgi:hypothetical protein